MIGCIHTTQCLELKELPEILRHSKTIETLWEKFQ